MCQTSVEAVDQQFLKAGDILPNGLDPTGKINFSALLYHTVGGIGSGLEGRLGEGVRLPSL